MPTLTRTQKYAGLREQLANDKEEKIASEDLASYQDRFNNVQETLTPETNKEPEYAWQPFAEEEPKQEVPVFEQEVKPIEFEEVKIEEETQAEQALQEEAKQEPTQPSYFDSFIGETNQEATNTGDFNSYFENTAEKTIEKISLDEIYSDVFDDVKDNSGEIVNLKERETYLNQTMSDVESYNINNGQKTIDTIVEKSVDEVRHPETVNEDVQEEPVDNTYAWTPFINEEEKLDADKVEEPQAPTMTAADKEFSDTVSIEIDKIMDDIASAPVEEKVEEVKVEEEKVEEPVQETIQIDATLTGENEEVVEIKNISEMKDENKDTMSSTIPFVVAAENEEVIEEDEEEGSNTVLNIILIVLIVVLVAVLGLIVFYILKTKGLFNAY